MQNYIFHNKQYYLKESLNINWRPFFSACALFSSLESVTCYEYWLGGSQKNDNTEYSDKTDNIKTDSTEVYKGRRLGGRGLQNKEWMSSVEKLTDQTLLWSSQYIIQYINNSSNLR